MRQARVAVAENLTSFHVRSDAETPAATVREPRIRTAIAVIMTRFPRVDETFILREIDELERHGQPVLVVPVLRGEGLVVHEEAKPWVKRAFYTPFLSAAILRSNLVAFLRNPIGYVALLWRLIAGTFFRPSTLIRTLALFPKSVHLAVVLPQKGIRHVHSHFATHATTVAYIISSLSDITYSFTVHGPDVFVHRLLLREKIARAKFIRAVSTFNKAFLCGLYPVLTEGKIEVVHSGVNPGVYERAAEDSAAARKQGERFRLLSVAALTPSRGFPFLIDACARLVKAGFDIECRIVGNGPLRELTQHWIAEHGLSDRVRLLGNLPQHEVARLMGETDAFVLPSIIAVDGQMDGIPISLMEAMAAGKPVVASAISGIPELVRSHVHGILVDAAYAERLAEAVRVLISDPELCRRLGEAGRQKVRSDFDLRHTTEKLVALFDRYEQVNHARGSAAARVRALNWSRLDAIAIGVRKVHERPESLIAEVAISDGITSRDVIVRRPRENDNDDPPVVRARNEFEVLSMLRQSLPQTLDRTNAIRYTVPRLLMFDEPNAALVVERADGRSLAGSLLDPRRNVPALRKAGTWLRTLQTHTRTSDDGRHILTAVVLLALRDLDLAAAGDRVLRRQRDEIIDRLRRLEGIIAQRPLPAVGQHGDFSPENVFIGNHRVDVIDFGRYREGLALEDVANMLLHLELRFAGWPASRALPKLRRAFLDGYGERVLDDEALQLFTLCKALQLLARFGATPAERHVLRKVIARTLS